MICQREAACCVRVHTCSRASTGLFFCEPSVHACIPTGSYRGTPHTEFMPFLFHGFEIAQTHAVPVKWIRDRTHREFQSHRTNHIDHTYGTSLDHINYTRGNSFVDHTHCTYGIGTHSLAVRGHRADIRRQSTMHGSNDTRSCVWKDMTFILVLCELLDGEHNLVQHRAEVFLRLLCVLEPPNVLFVQLPEAYLALEPVESARAHTHTRTITGHSRAHLSNMTVSSMERRSIELIACAHISQRALRAAF